MSSDDHGPLTLSPDMLAERIAIVDVADLTQWDRNPYQGDVGAAHTHLGAFGQLQIPVVVDGEVLFGGEFVAAEVVGPQHDGRMAVVDLTDLEWPREKLVGAVLGLHRQESLAQVDATQLLDLLEEVRKADEAWLTGAGYDPEDMEAIYAQLQRDQATLDGGSGADDVEAPDAFGSFDENDVETEHTCPKCGYAWSGNGG